MDHFHYTGHVLYCEGVPVAELAESYGTPLFVYSKKTLLHHLHQLQRAFAPAEPLICYSIKTNPNLAICRLMRENGTGFDVTSGGELFRALQAGGNPERIVFAGVGKTDREITEALDVDILMFNVESEGELAVLRDLSEQRRQQVRLAFRVNPDVDPKTHTKTATGKRGTKFGLDWERVEKLANTVLGHPYLKLTGIHMHLGSPIYSTEPYRTALERAVPLIEALREQGHDLHYLNMGGGFGIHYRKQEGLPADAFAEVILPAVEYTRCQLLLEPGRFIVGNAGILVSRVLFVKDAGGKRFVIQDAAMNDLIRPTLYDAFHRIWPVEPPSEVPAPPEDYESPIPHTRLVDIVGPVCESGDFLARDRWFPEVKRGDLLAIFSAGAYGMAMSSNYNGRCRAAEVLVDGDKHRLIRRRETYHDLIRPELEV
ncbi:MAG: diaminopimelate decarboxylase [Gemmatales bacterium]|nr:diaminopimelate decarboxylase [Gemmatales bacterium]MCS7160650.1 diaminopimelate decarboxylase [Gemmatales bacterium]MDW8175851.1 diaminopimelate decarboxylase [Gemmatales bacterium]MDW8224288.1 diaminopimelate decarboxylase [Gemmatales bacterium]